MQLRQLQRELQRDLLGDQSGIAAAIVDAPPLPAEARLAIYRNAYRIRLIDALDDTYSALHKLLGDETFESLADLFIAAQPSVHRSIRWYGRELAHFLTECLPFAEQPILSEVARFDWTLAEVFDAADAVPLERAALEAIAPDAWEELKFRFHPSLRRLEFKWNTVAVWQAVSDDAVPPNPDLALGPVRWLLWRQNLKNYFRSTDEIESAALQAALLGNPFADICSSMTAWLSEEEIPLRAASFIGTWVDSGIIIGIG
jgi:Putative DNA-binding domain